MDQIISGRRPLQAGVCEHVRACSGWLHLRLCVQRGVDHADLILTEHEETSVSQQLHNTDLLPGCMVVAADRQAAPAYEVASSALIAFQNGAGVPVQCRRSELA